MKKIIAESLILILILTACGKSNYSSTDTASTTTATETVSENVSETDTESDAEPQKPSKDEVLEKRAECLEGMSEEDISRLNSVIKNTNLALEWGYLFSNLFSKLSDPHSLQWNEIDYTGEILIGYAFEEGMDYDESCGMTYEEYGEKYGQKVVEYNEKDGEYFINIMSEIKDTIKNDKLSKDFDTMIEDMRQAKAAHDVQYIIDIYHIAHDMDYYLLRYGPEDMAMYVQDMSTVNTYYGALEVYK